MTKDIQIFKTALRQSTQDFLAINDLPPQHISDKFRSFDDDDTQENAEKSTTYSAGNILGRNPLGYVIHLLDLGIVSLPTAPHCAITIADNQIVELMAQFSLLGLSFDDVKILAQTINNSFHDAGYVFKTGQTDMTQASFLIDGPTVTLTYGEWQIKGKEDQLRYRLQISECNRFNSPQKYVPVFRATVVTEKMRKTIEMRKAYLSMK
ncbi:hypothetical protein [Bartonella sp. HY406]|uniref:hypothetical protein n=1 Tax=Bartonella sp. HY406 TaxID=2979331 RepID=UPI0021C8C250|nr:hypothetical protein [Bartonella sp. HY406]UXN02274.1 hypothetical protein N6B01_07120 [Bartonella sp. HY406]